MTKQLDAAIVTTTIYVPKLLAAYEADAAKHGRNVALIVIADKKTPPEAAAFCTELAAHSKFPIEYFSIERQHEYLSRFPQLRDHLPYNSIQRRNIGLLFAYESGALTIVTIDDDNFLVTKDFIGAHQVHGGKICDVVSTNTGWINVCALLKEKHGRTIYHRGFPLEKRMPGEKWKIKKASVRPVVNAGLWLDDPDVDAMERLYHLADPTEAVRYRGKRTISIAKGVWTPFNSQNTALRRDAIPAYFLSPRVGRYDDIWASYIIKHVADHLGDSITFGAPIVEQKRNPHNYWKDLDQERQGHALTLRFVEVLQEISLAGSDYKSCYAELAEKLPKSFSHEAKITDVEQAFLEGYFEGMRVWRDTFVRL